MATSPTFASVGHVGQIVLNNASGTSLSSAIITGVAAGTRIKEIRVVSGPTTAPGTGTLAIVVDNGTTQTYIDALGLSNTANLLQQVFTYNNLVLTGTGYSIKAIMSTAITSGGTVHITVLGEDLT
jgi:hypothetical protein